MAEKAFEDEIEVLVPTEEVIEIRRGKKVTSGGASCPAMCWCAWSCRTRPIIW